VSLQRVKLDDLGSWGSGGTPLASKPEYYGGDIPWLIIEDLNDGVVSRSTRKITSLGLENSSAKIVPPGTLLIAMYGSIGKLGITGISCATNQAIAYCKCDPSRVDTKFLFFLLLQDRARFLRAGRGGTQQNISQEFLKDHEIYLPDLSTQKRIVGLLEQADRLRRMRRYILELSDTFLPAAFVKFFGGYARDLPLHTVEELAASESDSIRTGPFGSQLLHSEFTHEGIAVLGIDNAVNNRFEWAERRFITPPKYEQLKRYALRPGDVIITIMGTCGRCAIVPEDIGTAINTKHLCCITLDQTRCQSVYLHSAFLYHPFVRHQLGAATKGAIMEGLNMELIRNLKIPVPTPSEQKRFVSFIASYERLRIRAHEALRQADHLFQSLLHRTFTHS